MPNDQPETRVWRFTDKKRSETRTYEQSELTIDGEMQLFGLINRSIIVLHNNGFPFDRLQEVFPAAGSTADDINWGAAAEMLSLAAPVVPSLASEAAAAFLGVFMTDEHGARNKSYDDDVAFLRRTMKTADLFEMLEVFIGQNDIERLRGPLVRALQSIFRLAESAPLSIPDSTSSSTEATAPPPTSKGTTRGKRSTNT